MSKCQGQANRLTMLSDAVEIRENDKYGKGHKSIFAVVDLPAGSPVWWDDPSDAPLEAFTRQQILAHPQKEQVARYSYMLAHDRYASTTDPRKDVSYYFNHSCAGNCWCVAFLGRGAKAWQRCWR